MGRKSQVDDPNLSIVSESVGASSGQSINKIRPEDRPAHDWYRFVLSFPPHLVREYVEKFGVRPHQTVLDPFCGTGTTLVECRKLGIRGIGIERNPVACFAARVKIKWDIDPDGLLEHAYRVSEVASTRFYSEGTGERDMPLFSSNRRCNAKLRSLTEECVDLILKNSISPLPLHKTLVLLDVLSESGDSRFADHERLALAKTIVFGASNLHFGPEVGVGRAKEDAPVVRLWLENVATIA